MSFDKIGQEDMYFFSLFFFWYELDEEITEHKLYVKQTTKR